MTSFIDYEKENNEFLNILRSEKYKAVVNTLLSKNATLLVPHIESLPKVPLTNSFIASHIVLRNPLDGKEMVNTCGMCILMTVDTSFSELKVISSPDKTLPLDFAGFQDKQRKREIIDGYKKSQVNAIQKIQILRESDILFPGKKTPVQIILIADCILLPGTNWENFAESGNDYLGNFTQQSIMNQVKKEVPSNPNSFKEQFWIKMKADGAHHITKTLVAFVPQFLKNPPAEAEQSKAVHGLIDKLVGQIAVNDLWNHPTRATDEEIYEIAYDALEKYIMKKIYRCCFAPSSENLTRDKLLNEKITRLTTWVTPEHFDIKADKINLARLKPAILELQKMDSYCPPKDKVICILNCCKVIYHHLNRAATASLMSAGADEFLPILIYTVIKANPKRLYSNLVYIQEFRRPSALLTETGYYLTHLMSCLMFIETCNAEMLNVSEAEFDKLMSVGPSSSVETPTPSMPTTTEEATTSATVSETSEGGTTAKPRESSKNSPFKTFKKSDSSNFSSMPRPSPNTSQFDCPTSDGDTPFSFSNPNTESETEFSDLDDPTPFLMRGSAAGRSASGASLTRVSANYPRQKRVRRLSVKEAHNLFMSCNAEELTIGEVPVLLEMYRELVKENEMLKMEREKSKNIDKGTQSPDLYY